MNSSVVRTQKAFRRNTGNRNHPSHRCISFIVVKFKALGTVADWQHPARSRTVRSIDNIESVRHDVTYNPQKSIRRRSEEIKICKTSLWRILREDLKCYSYKIQLVRLREKASISAVIYWNLFSRRKNLFFVDDLFSNCIYFGDRPSYWHYFASK